MRRCGWVVNMCIGRFHVVGKTRWFLRELSRDCLSIRARESLRFFYFAQDEVLMFFDIIILNASTELWEEDLNLRDGKRSRLR